MVKKNQPKKEDEKRLYAFLATFLSIIGFVIVLFKKRNDKYVMFYAKQSLVIFVVGIAASILSTAFSFIPVVGWVISFALNILFFLLWLVSWINALSGEMIEAPVVGIYGRSIDL